MTSVFVVGEVARALLSRHCMRSLSSLCPTLLISLTLSSTALAQPVELNPEPAPPVIAVVQPVPMCVPGPGRDPCLKRLLDMDPGYQAARSRRNLGIVLTSVGGAVGIITMVAAWASYMSRDIGNMFSSRENSYTGEKVAAIAGAGLLVTSLAVGIPTIVSGSREMRLIRNQRLSLVPLPSVSLGPRQAAFGAVWSF